MVKIEIEVFVKESGMPGVEDELLRSKIVSEGVNVILTRLIVTTKIFSEFRKNATWYLTAKSKKEAMEKTIISNGIVNARSNALISHEIMDDFPLVVEQLWNGYGDMIFLRNSIQNDYCNFSYLLNFSLDSESLAASVVNEMVRGIIINISPQIIRVETHDYSLNENHVFPDRLPVGWMFYTNKIYDENLAGLQKKTHVVTKGGEPIGTLFFSKPGFFDGSNKDDIKMANDLEMMLASYDILPAYRNIF